MNKTFLLLKGRMFKSNWVSLQLGAAGLWLARRIVWSEEVQLATSIVDASSMEVDIITFILPDNPFPPWNQTNVLREDTTLCTGWYPWVTRGQLQAVMLPATSVEVLADSPRSFCYITKHWLRHSRAEDNNHYMLCHLHSAAFQGKWNQSVTAFLFR